MAREWFRVKNQTADPSVAEIHIIDVIGGWDSDWFERNFGYDMGVTARKFVEALAALGPEVTAIDLHINSPGGDVQAGINIANALREQQMSKGRAVTTYIDGIAASIASVIAMSGSKVIMADNALMMIHNPYMLALGDAKEMRKAADVLDAYRAQIVTSYQWHSPLEDAAINALMDAETYMDADEAIANGFATSKTEGLKAAASLGRNAVKALKVPDKYRARVDALLQPEQTDPPKPQPASAADVLRICREADVLDLAEGLLAANATAETVVAKTREVASARRAASARATEIRQLCAAAKLGTLAEGYVSSAMSVKDVRAHLTEITGRLDNIKIDNTLTPVEKQSRIAASWEKAIARIRGNA